MLRALLLSILALLSVAAPAIAGPLLGDDVATCRERQNDAKVRLFDIVRDEVWTATKHVQQPFTYGSPPGREDFFFAAGK